MKTLTGIPNEGDGKKHTVSILRLSHTVKTWIYRFECHLIFQVRPSPPETVSDPRQALTPTTTTTSVGRIRPGCSVSKDAELRLENHLRHSAMPQRMLDAKQPSSPPVVHPQKEKASFGKQSLVQSLCTSVISALLQYKCVVLPLTYLGLLRANNNSEK